jgi:pyochelin biosynthetic protein PchC
MQAMTEVVERLARDAAALKSGPFAFFGHSMGAIIAFELARWLRARGTQVRKACTSPLPRSPVFRLDWRPGPEPDDARIPRGMRRLGGACRATCSNPELMRVALRRSCGRALVPAVHIQPAAPLDTPVYAYGGESDPNIRPEHLSRWAEVTSGPFVERMFPGGHFFIQSGARQFLQALAKDLNQISDNTLLT